MFSNVDYEFADIRAEQEREAKIAAVRAELRRQGSTECSDCGCSIAVARLRVIPSASRCLECQETYEHERVAR